MSKKSALQAPRLTKSKEELLAELNKNQKFVEKMKFTKEQFYPAMVKASRNIDDARSFLSSINSVLMQNFLTFMKEKKFSELNITDSLDPKDEKYEDYVAMFNLFNDMNVYEAKDIIEGMRAEINLFIDEELKERGLDTLKAHWLDEIK